MINLLRPPILFTSIILLSATVFAAQTRADVSLKNGNFFVYFRDISFPGGLEPKIERVYNSKSDFNGIFGPGWGSIYETRLRVENDGTIVISEFGGGAEDRFVPKNYQLKNVDTAVAEILAAAKKAGIIGSLAQEKEYVKRLKSESVYRTRQNQSLIARGLLAKKEIKVGTQMTSTRFFYRYLTKVADGYSLVMEAGNVQKFNDSGLLIQVQDRNKNSINFTYNANGKMTSLVDNQNRKMQFSYNPQGLLVQVAGESGKSASFRYSKDGFLEYSKDDQGVENGFKYTNDAYRNLSEISFPSEKDASGKIQTLGIGYHGSEKNVNVKTVKNRDGTVSTYDYSTSPKNKDLYEVRVVLKTKDGALISDSKYQYFSKPKPDGETFTYKMITDIDGDRTEETYDPKLGFPVKIDNNGRITTMAYDQKGRLVKKTTPIETTTLNYDEKVGKVSKVNRKLRGGATLWSTFDYEATSGNLVLAKNSEKKQVKLVYDGMGRIRALTDQTGKQLTFKYNEFSKPIEIADSKLGTLKMTYKNSGELDKMDNNGGVGTATEVLRALQNLIDITAPAGVTMSI